MEVHLPHKPIHSWRDFFIHLFTITVGLLIALALEGMVESMHHRHLLHRAEENLRTEMRENREQLAKDEAQLQAGKKQFAGNLQILMAVRAHQPGVAELGFHWYWSDMQASAWTTARDTGALALMPYEHAQGYSVVYGQQEIVNRQSEVYVADIYRAGAPLEGGRKVGDLQPADLDALIASTQQTLSDIKHLNDLCRSLDNIYDRAGNL